MPTQPPRPIKPFAKPSRKSREEPPGLDAFAAGVPGAARAVVPPPSSGTEYLEQPGLTEVFIVDGKATRSPPRPPEARETLGMNVRFTPEQKALLVRLAQKEGRSQHQVLKRLLDPVLRNAASHLDEP